MIEVGERGGVDKDVKALAQVPVQFLARNQDILDSEASQDVRRVELGLDDVV